MNNWYGYNKLEVLEKINEIKKCTKKGHGYIWSSVQSSLDDLERLINSPNLISTDDLIKKTQEIEMLTTRLSGISKVSITDKFSDLKSELEIGSIRNPLLRMEKV